MHGCNHLLNFHIPHSIPRSVLSAIIGASGGLPARLRCDLAYLMHKLKSEKPEVERGASRDGVQKQRYAPMPTPSSPRTPLSLSKILAQCFIILILR